MNPYNLFQQSVSVIPSGQKIYLLSFWQFQRQNLRPQPFPRQKPLHDTPTTQIGQFFHLVFLDKISYYISNFPTPSEAVATGRNSAKFLTNYQSCQSWSWRLDYFPAVTCDGASSSPINKLVPAFWGPAWDRSDVWLYMVFILSIYILFYEIKINVINYNIHAWFSI